MIDSYRFCLVIAVAVSINCSQCGDDDDGDEPEGIPLTCATFEEPGFCWHQVRDEALTCWLTGEGQFTADRSRCTHPQGPSVAFDVPVPVPPEGAMDPDPFDDYEWNFTMEKNGTQCLRFEQLSGGFKLTTAGGTYESDGSFTGFSIACPDGTLYKASDPMALVEECGFDAFPGYNWSHSFGADAWVGFSLVPAEETDGSVDPFSNLWRCLP